MKTSGVRWERVVVHLPCVGNYATDFLLYTSLVLATMPQTAYCTPPLCWQLCHRLLVVHLPCVVNYSGWTSLFSHSSPTQKSAAILEDFLYKLNLLLIIDFAWYTNISKKLKIIAYFLNKIKFIYKRTPYFKIYFLIIYFVTSEIW